MQGKSWRKRLGGGTDIKWSRGRKLARSPVFRSSGRPGLGVAKQQSSDHAGRKRDPSHRLKTHIQAYSLRLTLRTHEQNRGFDQRKPAALVFVKGQLIILPWWTTQGNDKVDKRTAWQYLCWILRKSEQFTIFVFYNGISWNCKRQHLWKLLWKIKQHFHKSAGIATKLQEISITCPVNGQNGDEE